MKPMNSQKLTELLDLVFKSLQFKLNNNDTWIKPESDTSYYRTYDFNKKSEVKIDAECKKYEFIINQTSDSKSMKFTFRVCITKINRTSGFWKKIDNSRYITHIRVMGQPNTYSSVSELESYYLDTDEVISSSTRELQSKMFILLESAHLKKQNEKENEKIESYIDEIKKSVDKSLVRDEKIDNILDKVN